MELGNMLFGNSRGQFPVARGAGFEEELSRLFDSYAPDRDTSWREYGAQFENDVFSVFPYYWGDCTCGYEERWDEKESKWSAENPHADNCYQTELRARLAKYKHDSGYDAIDRAAHGGDHSIFSGFDNEVTTDGPLTTWIGKPRKDAAMEAWRKAYDKLRKFEDGLYDELCEKYKKPRQGCAIHCTCGRDKRFAEFAATDNHDAKCPIVQPNFRYKPTGYELCWYKYPLRDSYQSKKLRLAEFRHMIDACIASVK